MKTICSCGFDCSDFVAQHAIAAGARFTCPDCELALSAAEESSANAHLELGAPAMAVWGAQRPNG
jgi:hypothetical protein